MTFSVVQAKRHLADYDLNALISQLDAKTAHRDATRVIRQWRAATSVADRDFKHALSVLLLLQGNLRQDK